jgi:TPR repeat protein
MRRLLLPLLFASTVAFAANDRLQIGPSNDAELAGAWAAYQAGEMTKARERYLAAAKHQNRLAQFNLAVMLVAGLGGEPDPQQGLDWLRKAADGKAGLPRAQYSLAQFYERGELVERSLTEATAWYRKAAEGGWRDAQVNLATQYFLGRGAPKDYAEAARWYEKAADQGDVGAQYIIASMYENGDGVAVNLERAIFWYHAAAEQGDIVARDKLPGLMDRLNKAK